jgi:hypothetical protein
VNKSTSVIIKAIACPVGAIPVAIDHLLRFVNIIRMQITFVESHQQLLVVFHPPTPYYYVSWNQDRKTENRKKRFYQFCQSHAMLTTDEDEGNSELRALHFVKKQTWHNMQNWGSNCKM